MSELPEGVTAARLEQEVPERFNRLRAPLGVTSFGINQMVLAPGQRGRIHRHRGQEEVYLVLAGTLTLIVEGDAHEFGVGELVRVAPEVRRQLVNRRRQPLSLLALGGLVEHEHEGRDAEAFVSWEATEFGTPQSVPVPDDLPVDQLA